MTWGCFEVNVTAHLNVNFQYFPYECDQHYVYITSVACVEKVWLVTYTPRGTGGCSEERPGSRISTLLTRWIFYQLMEFVSSIKTIIP